MRAVLQRVAHASVSIDGKTHAEIKRGYLVLLGVNPGANVDDIDYLTHKIVNLRVFNDEAGKMNLSLADINGEALVISQFTLFADSRKGNRPSFASAAPPAEAEAMYNEFVTRFAEAAPAAVLSGIFAADMKVSLLNDGPVTIMLDSRQR